jgi:hypothetical protein
LLCVALRCFALLFVALRCFALLCVALRCFALLFVAFRCFSLLFVAFRCFSWGRAPCRTICRGMPRKPRIEWDIEMMIRDPHLASHSAAGAIHSRQGIIGDGEHPLISHGQSKQKEGIETTIRTGFPFLSCHALLLIAQV